MHLCAAAAAARQALEEAAAQEAAAAKQQQAAADAAAAATIAPAPQLPPELMPPTPPEAQQMQEAAAEVPAPQVSYPTETAQLPQQTDLHAAADPAAAAGDADAGAAETIAAPPHLQAAEMTQQQQQELLQQQLVEQQAAQSLQQFDPAAQHQDQQQLDAAQLQHLYAQQHMDPVSSADLRVQPAGLQQAQLVFAGGHNTNCRAQLQQLYAHSANVFCRIILSAHIFKTCSLMGASRGCSEGPFARASMKWAPTNF